MNVIALSLVETLFEFLDPGTLSEVVIQGLAKSAVYIMIASGLTLIFGLMGVLNFAHGSLTMIGAYLGGLFMVIVATGRSPLVVLVLFLVGILVVTAALALLGGVLEVGLIRPLYDRSPIYQILLTFGVTLVLDELVRIVVAFYGIQPISDWREAMGTKPALISGTTDILGLSVRALHLFEIAFGALTVAAVWAFLTKTRYGLYVRAGSEDDEMAEALGIDVGRVFTLVFALGAGLAGAAGMLLMWDPLWGASIELGPETLLPAFVVVIIGGLGTFRGTIVAGLIVGGTDAVMTWWFQNAITFTGLPEMTIFLLLVISLILRPQGLYGVQEVGGH